MEKGRYPIRSLARLHPARKRAFRAGSPTHVQYVRTQAGIRAGRPRYRHVKGHELAGDWQRAAAGQPHSGARAECRPTAELDTKVKLDDFGPSLGTARSGSGAGGVLWPSVGARTHCLSAPPGAGPRDDGGQAAP
eukprot:2105641-Rhodomonas_salina.1